MSATPSTTPATTPTQETLPPATPQEVTQATAEVEAVETKMLTGPERAAQLTKEVETLREKNEVLKDWINDNPLTKGGDVIMDEQATNELKNLKAKAEELIKRIDSLERLLKPGAVVEKQEAETKPTAETPDDRVKKQQELQKTKTELEAYQKALRDYQTALKAWENIPTPSEEFKNYKAEMERITDKLFEHYQKTQSLTERDLKSLEDAIQRDVEAVAKELQDQAA